jgi:hypothetical protein
MVAMEVANEDMVDFREPDPVFAKLKLSSLSAVN